MKTYLFTIYLRGLDDISEELADRLYEAGCDDCLPCSGNGLAYARFSREAATLDAAISSALADLARAGCQADRVEIVSDNFGLLQPTA